MKNLYFLFFLTLLILPIKTNAQAVDTDVIIYSETEHSRYEVYSTDLKLEKESYEIGETVKGSFIVHNINSFSLNDLVFDVSLAGQYSSAGIPAVYFDTITPEKIPSISPKNKQTINFEYKIPSITTGNNLGIQVVIKSDSGRVLSWIDAPISVTGEAVELLILKDIKLKVRDLELSEDAETFDYEIQHGPTLQKKHQGELEISFTNLEDFNVDIIPNVIIFDKSTSGEVVEKVVLEQKIVNASSDQTLSWILPKPEKPGVYLARVNFLNQEEVQVALPVEVKYIIAGDIFTIVDVTTDVTSVKSGDTFPVFATIIGNPIDIVDYENVQKIQDTQITLSITINDASGKIVATNESPFNLNESKDVSVSLTAESSSNEMIINTKLLDENGNVLASHVANLPKGENDYNISTVLLYILLGIVLALVVSILFKHKKSLSNIKVVIVILFVGMSGIFFNTENALAVQQEYSVGGNGINLQYNPNNVTVNSPQPPSVRSYTPGESFNFQVNFDAAACNNGPQYVSVFTERDGSIWAANTPPSNVLAYSSGADITNLSWWGDVNNGKLAGSESDTTYDPGNHSDSNKLFSPSASDGYTAPSEPGIYRFYFYIYNDMDWYKYQTTTDSHWNNNRVSQHHSSGTGWYGCDTGGGQYKHCKDTTTTVPNGGSFGAYLGYQEVAVDACTNLSAPIQPDATLVPEGYQRIETECFLIDVCDNIGGEQPTVPAGLIQQGNDCVEDGNDGCNTQGEVAYTIASGPFMGDVICTPPIVNSCESFSDLAMTVPADEFVIDDTVYYKSTPTGGTSAEYTYQWNNPLIGTVVDDPAGSCLEIKQANPNSPDGIYWIETPAMGSAEQFYCDMTNENGGWVLIGRGREDWAWTNTGSGTSAEVRNPVTGASAFVPKYLSSGTINGLLNNGNVNALADGILLRRAANSTGTEFQHAIMKLSTQTSWSWIFDNGGVGFPMSSWSTSDTSQGAGITNLTGEDTRDNYTVAVGNGANRVWTFDWTGQQSKKGFAYGSNVTFGAYNNTNFGFMVGENHTTPFTQVLIKPNIKNSLLTSTTDTQSYQYTSAGEFSAVGIVGDHTNNTGTGACSIKVHECLVSENTDENTKNLKCPINNICEADVSGIERCVVRDISITSCKTSDSLVSPLTLPQDVTWTVYWKGGTPNFSVEWDFGEIPTDTHSGLSTRTDQFTRQIPLGTENGTRFSPTITVYDSDAQTPDYEYICQQSVVTDCDSSCVSPYSCYQDICQLAPPDIYMSIDPKIVELGQKCELTVSTGVWYVNSCSIINAVTGAEVYTFDSNPGNPEIIYPNDSKYDVDPGIYNVSCNIGLEISYLSDKTIECSLNSSVKEN